MLSRLMKNQVDGSIYVVDHLHRPANGVPDRRTIIRGGGYGHGRVPVGLSISQEVQRIHIVSVLRQRIHPGTISHSKIERKASGKGLTVDKQYREVVCKQERRFMHDGKS